MFHIFGCLNSHDGLILLTCYNTRQIHSKEKWKNLQYIEFHKVTEMNAKGTAPLTHKATGK